MIKWLCAAALAFSVAAPALAQKPADRPLKRIKEYDTAPIQDGIKATGKAGSCLVNFTVGTDGHAKNIAADCTAEEFVPFVVKAVEGAAWEAEIVGGDLFESRPLRQTFNFGPAAAAPVVDPRGEKPPLMVRGVQKRDIEMALGRMKEGDKCDLKFTVGADGIPKDILPNCTVDSANAIIVAAVKKMKYNPGEKGAAPTDWPGISMPITLAPPDPAKPQ